MNLEELEEALTAIGFKTVDGRQRNILPSSDNFYTEYSYEGDITAIITISYSNRYGLYIELYYDRPTETIELEYYTYSDLYLKLMVLFPNQLKCYERDKNILVVLQGS